MIYAVLVKQFLLQMGAHIGGVDGYITSVVLAKIIIFRIFTAEIPQLCHHRSGGKYPPDLWKR
jgi:hypothetical protein